MIPVGSGAMKRDIVAKRVIQVVACGFGLVGLLWAFGGAGLVVTSVRESEGFWLFITAPFFFVLGGIGIAVAWQALRRFGPNAIRNVVGLFMYLAWSQLAWFPKSSQHGEALWRSHLLEAALVLGPLCLALLLYRILSRKLIQMTEPAALSDGPDAAPNQHERDLASRNE